MYQPTIDLARQVCFRPNFFQTKGRINYLIDRYLNEGVKERSPVTIYPSSSSSRNRANGHTQIGRIYIQNKLLVLNWIFFCQLTPEYLYSCCATPKFFGNNSVECDQPKVIIV